MRNPDPRVAKAPRKIEALDKTKANQRAWRLISQPIQIRECIRCSAFWSLYQYPIRELAALGGLFKTAKTKQMGTFKRCNATRNYLLPPLKPITPFPSLLRISRRKPTPRVHPPPWDQEGGSTKQRRGEEGTNPAGDSSIEAGLFFKVFCGSLGSLRGESRAPPPWGRRKLKTKTRGLLQPRLWRQRCPQRGRAWGAGAAPQLEGGRTASGMKLGLWGRGGRRWQGGGRVRCRSGSTAEAAGPRPLETGSEAPAAPSPHRTVTPRAGGGASPARWVGLPGIAGFLCSWLGLGGGCRSTHSSAPGATPVLPSAGGWALEAEKCWREE